MSLAGSSPRDGIVTEAPEEEFWRVIRLDRFGTFLSCKHGLPALIRAGGGSVINMTSMAALMAIPERDCYTAAKGGVARAHPVPGRRICAARHPGKRHRTRHHPYSPGEGAGRNRTGQRHWPNGTCSASADPVPHRAHGRVPRFRRIAGRHRPDPPGGQRRDHPLTAREPQLDFQASSSLVSIVARRSTG